MRWILLAAPLAAAAAAALALTGCDRAPSIANLREWTAADHDRNAKEEADRIAAGQSTARKNDNGQALVDATWSQQCASCHGLLGKGDGPSGPMVHATDLTSEDWQAKVSDTDIATSIRMGKGKMPKFDSLPDVAVQGLVARVRSLRGR
jgi:mono/diheme cytochrome c family protein